MCASASEFGFVAVSSMLIFTPEVWGSLLVDAIISIEQGSSQIVDCFGAGYDADSSWDVFDRFIYYHNHFGAVNIFILHSVKTGGDERFSISFDREPPGLTRHSFFPR